METVGRECRSHCKLALRLPWVPYGNVALMLDHEDERCRYQDVEVVDFRLLMDLGGLNFFEADQSVPFDLVGFNDGFEMWNMSFVATFNNHL